MTPFLAISNIPMEYVVYNIPNLGTLDFPNISIRMPSLVKEGIAFTLLGTECGIMYITLGAKNSETCFLPYFMFFTLNAKHQSFKLWFFFVFSQFLVILLQKRAQTVTELILQKF